MQSVGAHVAGVRSRGATSALNRVTVGWGGAQSGWVGADVTGPRPMSASTSTAQSNRTGVCGTELTIVRSVGDGAGSRTTLSWLSSILSSSSVSNSSRSASHSLAFSHSSALLCCFSSLSSVSSELSHCSIFDLAVIVVVSLTSDRAGTCVTCRTSGA